MKKIALFYRVWFDSGEEILAAGKKLGVDLRPINYGDLVLRQEGKRTEIFHQGESLADFDLFYFRAVGAAAEWAHLLVLFAKERGIPIVDEYLGVWGPGRRLKSIAGMILGQEGVVCPKTSLVSDKGQLEEERKKYSFPFVLKLSKGGRHGMGTLLVRDKEVLERAVKGRIEKSTYLIQEYVPNEGDYRLFLVGYKALGAFKRQKKDEKLVLNQSLGPSEKLEEIPPEVRELAEKAARVLRVEIAAVDMVIDKRTGKGVVIEVNEAPQFKVFKKRTGVDVPRKIVEYLAVKAK